MILKQSLPGNKTTLPVAWSLAAVFFLTTVAGALFAIRKYLRRNCNRADADSEHVYVENVIMEKPSGVTADIAEDTLYNNHELYEL